MQDVEALTDEQLIDAFVEATDKLTQEEAAQRGGVKQPTVSEWRRGVRRALLPETRRGLESYLREGRADYGTSAESAAREIWPDPFVEVMVREARAAEKRADAAASWARARERAESAAELRAWAAAAPTSEGAEGAGAGPRSAFPPGVAHRLLRQVLEELQQAENPDRRAASGPRT